MNKRQQIINTLRTAPDTGLTTDEVVTFTSLDLEQAANIIGRLVRDGKIKAHPIKKKNNNTRWVTSWIVCPESDVVVKTPRTKRARKPSNGTTAPNGHAFWADIRGRINQHVSQQTDVIDQGLFSMYYREFEAELKSCIAGLLARLRRAYTPRPEVVSRRKVLDACHILQMRAPTAGTVASLNAAKQGKRRLVRVYHSDIPGNAGNDSVRAMYEAVIAAYETLELYNDSLTRSSDNATTQEG